MLSKKEIEELDKKFEKMPAGMADKMRGTGSELGKKKAGKKTVKKKKK